ncbi:hypothetical protein J0H58_25795 [bacterium]|nr:hypothetical protein [bacterium]
MRRLWVCLTTFVAAAILPTAAAQPPAGWSTVKGQVVLKAGMPILERAPLAVNQDKEHCLSKGPILDESMIVNAKNRGIKNVVVWLRPNAMNAKATLAPNEIHPADAKRKPAEVVIDQPCCMFIQRMTVARVGDKIVVKNPSPVQHNFFWTSSNNGDLNVNIPAKNEYKFAKALEAENTPILFKCTVHPWMSGYVRVFDHPYYAVTDDDGNFTIPNAPQGMYRLVVWHESTGFLGGAAGRFGTPVAITGPVTTLAPLNYP